MKFAKLPPARLPVAALAAWLLIGNANARLPGAVSPDHPQLSPAAAAAMASVSAPDGSVFVLGNFTSVNGLPWNGLAKFAPDGGLDENFKPRVSFTTDRELWIRFEGSPFNFENLASVLPRPLVTTDGTLLVPRSDRMLAFAPDGTIDLRFDALNDTPGRLRPLFESGGRIFFERELAGVAALEIRRSDDLALIDLPDLFPPVATLLAAIPAADGKAWLLARRESSPGPVIHRLNPDLTADPEFTPIQLPGATNYGIYPTSGGGFRLASSSTSHFSYWPQPSSSIVTWHWYSEEGALLRSANYGAPLGSAIVGGEETGGSLLRSEIAAGRSLLIRELPDGSRDPGFEVDLSADQVEVLADGRIRHSHIRRVLADGSPDPDWNVPVLAAHTPVETFGQLPDGRVIAGRLDAATPNADFAELLILDATLNLQPTPQLAGIPRFRSASISPDGAIVLLLSGPHIFADGSKTLLLRVLPDSGIDSNSPRYLPTHSNLIPPPLLISPISSDSIYQFRPLPAKRYLVELIGNSGDVSSRRIVRLLANGAPDPGFYYNGPFYFGSPASLLADGSFIVAGKYHAPNGLASGPMPFDSSPVAAETDDGWIYLLVSTGDDLSRLVRWDPVSGVDPSFQSPFPKGSSIARVASAGDGKLVVTGHLLTGGGVEEMVRLHPDGRLDPSFQPDMPRRLLPLAPWTTGVLSGGQILPPTPGKRLLPTSPRRLTQPTWLPSRNLLLVSGDFTHLGDEPRPSIGTLDPGGAWTFAEWFEAWFPGVPPDPEGDRDGDGTTDYHEFMVGSDPTRADLAPGLTVIPGPWPAFHLPLDPAALGPDPVLELSTDLETWHDAEVDQAILWSYPDGITWWPLGTDPRVFGRARLSENPSNR